MAAFTVRPQVLAPLSWQQQALLDDESRSGRDPFNCVLLLDLQALTSFGAEAAIADFAARHDALRICLSPHGWVAAEQISDGPIPPVKRFVVHSRQEALDRAALLGRTVFDRSRSLWYAEVIIYQEDPSCRQRELLIMVIDHMIADAVSIELLRRELVCGTKARRAAPSFTQYITWQRREYALIGAAEGAYWRRVFRSVSEELNMRPVDTHDPIAGSVRMPLLSGSQWKKLGRSIRGTPFMGVLSGASYALGQTLFESDTLINVVVAGRVTRDEVGAFGWYANRLPVVFARAGSAAVAELLDEVRKQWGSLVRRQRTPMPFIRQAAMGSCTVGLDVTLNFVRQDPAELSLVSTPGSQAGTLELTLVQNTTNGSIELVADYDHHLVTRREIVEFSHVWSNAVQDLIDVS